MKTNKNCIDVVCDLTKREIVFNVAESEFSFLLSRAEHHGMSLSEYLRFIASIVFCELYCL